MKILYASIMAISVLRAQPVGEAGLFNREQAEQGRELYASQGCASCHGQELAGASAPALSGPSFAQRWSGRPVSDLFTLQSTTMPPGKSGSLTPQQHAAIFAYILMRNGYAPGGSPFVGDSPGLKSTLMRGDRAAVTGKAAPEFIPGKAKPVAAGAGPTQAELNEAATSKRDWLYHTHDYAGARYVAADQINTSNAARMQAVCAFQIGDNENFQTGPIVYDGVMFLTTPHATIAVDATNCRPKWRYTWQAQAQDVWLTNRGWRSRKGGWCAGRRTGI